jgi:hypothetical protein
VKERKRERRGKNEEKNPNGIYLVKQTIKKNNYSSSKSSSELIILVAHDPKNPSLFVRTFVDNLINFNSSNFFFHLASNFYIYKVFISSKLDHFILNYIFNINMHLLCLI